MSLKWLIYTHSGFISKTARRLLSTCDVFLSQSKWSTVSLLLLCSLVMLAVVFLLLLLLSKILFSFNEILMITKSWLHTSQKNPHYCKTGKLHFTKKSILSSWASCDEVKHPAKNWFSLMSLQTIQFMTNFIMNTSDERSWMCCISWNVASGCCSHSFYILWSGSKEYVCEGEWG